MARVGVVFGGRSVEHQVSIVSARSVGAALRDAGHEVVPLGVAQDGCWMGPEASAAALWGSVASLEPLGLKPSPTVRHLLAAPIDVVFPITHGTWGEDGTLQGLCEMLDLAYVGAGVAASAVAMDKLLAKRVLRAAGVPVVEHWSISRADFERQPAAGLERLAGAPLPLFVKPSVGGSSVGIRKVERREELAAALEFALRFDDTALVERGVEGRELECGVLGYETLAASAVGEIVPGNDFYDYQDKYLQDRARLLAPAELPDAVAEEVRRLAVEAFAAIGGAGMARVDFFLEDADPEPRLYVNEINTLPGFTSISMYPRLWELSGVPPPQLVDRLVEIARRRHAARARLDRGIKEWLAGLGGRA
jgi:D-alanine-D-alanine ligase